MEANNYELMIVANSDRGDQLVSRIEKLIKEADAKDLKVERLGRKTLAYAIKKQETAAYYLLNFDISADAVKKITDKLRLEQEDLLRYLLIHKTEVKLSKKKIRKSTKSEAEEEAKPKPKVTVAVKQASAVKSSTDSRKGGKASTKSITGIKSIKGTKGKSK